MNIQGLIERYEKFKASKKKMTSVDLVLKDLRSLDEPESLPFKLKDVVGRIRGFDPITQAIWLNKILDELGSDYGLMIYRSGYEQGKIEGAWVGNQLKDADKIRRELNQVKVPQCVAVFITEQKKLGHTLSYSIDASMSDRVAEWYWDNSEIFARAWLDGYEVEKEKRYLVKVKGVCGNHETLNCEKHSNEWLFSSSEENRTYKTKFTRKELEGAGFGWVFDCEGVEIEEVEDE